MIITDTNVFSEALRPQPDAQVLRWMKTRRKDLCMSVIVAQELLFGALLLPKGERQRLLEREVRTIIEKHSPPQPYTILEAEQVARLLATCRRAGRPMDILDAMIAATALTQGAPLATRNTKDFAGLGIDLINPWEYDGQVPR